MKHFSILLFLFLTWFILFETGSCLHKLVKASLISFLLNKFILFIWRKENKKLKLTPFMFVSTEEKTSTFVDFAALSDLSIGPGVHRFHIVPSLLVKRILILIMQQLYWSQAAELYVRFSPKHWKAVISFSAVVLYLAFSYYFFQVNVSSVVVSHAPWNPLFLGNLT